MTGIGALVSIVDDDRSVRESLPHLLRCHGFAVATFPSAETFLASGIADRTGCLLLDVAMPSMTGPELQQELTRRGHSVPIVFISAADDRHVHALVRQRGAAGMLVKPFSEEAIVDAVYTALRTPPRPTEGTPT